MKVWLKLIDLSLHHDAACYTHVADSVSAPTVKGSALARLTLFHLLLLSYSQLLDSDLCKTQQLSICL